MHWSDVEEIVEALEETYSEEEIPEYNKSYLVEMVLSLPEFDDHEIEPTDVILKQIIESWLDMRSI
jgi:FeS assembly protein IscX